MEVHAKKPCSSGVDFMSYAVVRMAKMKSHDLKGIQFHNQRERESRTNPDIVIDTVWQKNRKESSS